RFRMDVVASNIANAETTRGRLVNGEWEPYRRKLVVMEPKQKSFSELLQAQMNGETGGASAGVKVTQVVEDNTEFKRVYNPEHPDADVDGFVLMPNVDIVKEMVDFLAATRSYEANITVLNASKAIY